MKKIVVVTSSPRKGGNSETLADYFADGAREAGNEVVFIAVRDINLQFCTGCMYCQSHDGCILGDGMNHLYEYFQYADVIVFATPIYYYSLSGQMKTLLDRLNPIYPRENHFTDVYLLATSAENDESAMDGAIHDLEGWVSCFEGVRLAGVLKGVGVEAKGDIDYTDFPAQAFEMGKNA